MLLLKALHRPDVVTGWTLSQWDLVLRRARLSELAANLAHRLTADGAMPGVPSAPARHLTAAWNLHIHRCTMANHLLRALEPVLAGAGYPVILLKGAAYLAQDLGMAKGRNFDDVDILVPRDALDDAEARLIGAGWKSTMPDSYDQNYYRRWSHELPPMEHPRHALQLDVHHTILPVTGRVRPDARFLCERAAPVEGTPWHALSPSDQVVHAVAHVMQDSDCVGRLRDFVDVHGLLEAHMRSANAWEDLVGSAERHGLGRALWYVLRYASAWLHTAVPEQTKRRLDGHKPPASVVAAMDRLVPAVVFGDRPDARPGKLPSIEAMALKARALWLRMPVPLLVYHSVMKVLRSIRVPGAVKR